VTPIGGYRPESLLRVLEDTNVSAFFDEWGPVEVLQVYDPEASMQGILVLDNLTLGTGQEEMKAFAHVVGDLLGATGKPPEMGGIPYELGVAGFGMGLVAETYLQSSRHSKPAPSDLAGVRVAVQGFDITGSALVNYLVHKGATVVAVTDDWGGVQDPKGLDISKMLKHSRAPNERQSLAHFRGPARLHPEDIVKTDCDVLALTGAGGLVKEQSAPSVRAKCVVEGPGCPVSPVAEQLLKSRGYVVHPDPADPEVIKAFENGSFKEFERHSRVGMVTKEGFLKRVKELRDMGAKYVFLKTGAYRPADLARAVKFSSLAREKKYIPEIAVAGGFAFEDQVFKGLAIGAPYFKLVGMARGPLAAAMVGKTLGRKMKEGQVPVYVKRFGTTPEEIFVTAPELAAELGPKFKDVPTGAFGLYTYLERIAQGLRQLMCGSRKFALKHMTRDDLVALTREAAEISGLRYVIDADADEVERILKD